jgi:hypothetical protein
MELLCWRHGSWWQTGRNWILIAQFCPLIIESFFCFAQFVSDCVLCNPSILKLQGQEYYGIISTAQIYWPSKDTLSLSRCVRMVLTHECEIQSPSAISFIRLFAVSYVGLRRFAIVSGLASEHWVLPNISCMVRMDVQSGSQWTVVNWIFYGLF